MQAKHGILFMMLALFVALAGCGGGETPPGGTAPPTADRTPDPFSFEAVENANPGDFHEATATIAGLDDGETVPASLANLVASGFELLINDEVQGSHLDQTVQNGDVVTVRLQAGDEPDTVTSGELLVGEPAVSAVFSVTTKADVVSPELAVHFPPPVSATDIPLPGIVTVRGKVMDDWPNVTLHVNDVDVAINTVTGDWSVDVAVNEGDNLLEVRAVDAGGNEVLKSLMLTHVASLDGLAIGGGAAIDFQSAEFDASSEAWFVFGANRNTELSLVTGERRLLESAFVLGRDGFIDSNRHRRIQARRQEGALFAYRESGGSEVLTRWNDGNGPSSPIFDPISLALGVDGQSIAVLAEDENSDYMFWRVNAETGVREVFEVDPFQSGLPRSIATNPLTGGILLAQGALLEYPTLNDSFEQRVPESGDVSINQIAGNDGKYLWAFNHANDSLMKIDLETFVTALAWTMSDPATGPVFPGDIRISRSNATSQTLLYSTTSAPPMLGLLDLTTGQRVVVGLEL